MENAQEGHRQEVRIGIEEEERREIEK